MKRMIVRLETCVYLPDNFSVSKITSQWVLDQIKMAMDAGVYVNTAVRELVESKPTDTEEKE